jgi:hypothetical protein
MLIGDEPQIHLSYRDIAGPPQSRASEARMRPIVDSPYSSTGSDRAGHDQSSAALPYDAISNAKTF